MESPKKALLSKTILDMKFMKKTKERVEKEEDDAQGQAMYSKEITDKMRESGQVNFIETSISGCKDLIDGRLSFGGMNPEIEKIMQDEFSKKVAEVERRKETDISDVQMAEQYSTLVDTIGKKFKKKNKGAKKFIKPSE